MSLSWVKWKLTCPNCKKVGEMILASTTGARRSTVRIVELSPEYTYISTGDLFEQGDVQCRWCALVPDMEAEAFGRGNPPEPVVRDQL